jgi:hypothetical protein
LAQVQEAGVVQGGNARHVAQRLQDEAVARIVADLVQHARPGDATVRQRGVRHRHAGRRLCQPVGAGRFAIVVVGQRAEQDGRVVGDAVPLRRQRGEGGEALAVCGTLDSLSGAW